MERREMLQAISAIAVLGPQAPAAHNQVPAAAGPAPARVDVHAHYLPPPYQQALQDAGLSVDRGMPLPGWTVEAHLAAMTERGITSSLLSVSSPGLDFLDAATAVRVARQVNEAGAQLAHDHPGKFGFLALLPLPDMRAALAEMAHALDVLGADGVALETNSHGRYWGDPAFAPLFDELERRKAVVFLHPTAPACFEQVGMGFPAPLIEFPFDTARAVVSLIFSETLKRRPSIRVILAHGGGALPILLGRIASVAEAPFVHPRPAGAGAEVLDQVSRLYFDLALCASPLNFQALLQITSVAHVVFGTDYPFAPAPSITGNTKRYESLLADLSPEHRRMIEYANAAELFPRLQRYLAAG